MKIVYTALFVSDIDKLKHLFNSIYTNKFYHHSTIEFGAKDLDDIEIGKKHKIKIVGRLTTNKIDCLVINNPKSSNKFPHITLSTNVGIKPFESNVELEKHNDEIEYLDTSIYIEMVEGYFNGVSDIIK
jgi:hypothetical protein